MRTKKLILLLTTVAWLIAGCSSTGEQSLSPPTTPEEAAVPAASAATSTSAHSPISPPALDSSTGAVPQLVDDLANRLDIPREQIALRGLRPVVWQKESLDCPPLPDSTAPLEHVMIITEEGARYEEPGKDFKPGQASTILVLLEANETTYPYYILEGEFLPCPPEE